MIATILDTETTGLIANHSVKIDRQPHIVEFYAGVFDLRSPNESPIDEVETFIRPPIKMPADAAKITRITDETLKDAPVFSQVADPIADIIERAEVVIAHNASFDREMIDIEFERLGRKLQWPKLICTVEATIHLTGFRLSLTALHEKLFGEKFPEAHRAKRDVAALTRCCVALFQRGEI